FSFYNYYTGNAHSQLLQQFAETGIVGALLFLVFFIPLFKNRPGKDMFAPGALLCLFSISLVDGIMALPLIAVTMFILAAFSVSSNENAQQGACGMPVLPVVVLAAVGLLMSAYAQELQSKNRSGAAERKTVLGGIVALNPLDDAAYFSLALLAKRQPAAIELLERAVELNPYNAVYRFDLAKALNEFGNRLEAEKQLARCLELEPNFAEVALYWAGVRLGAGERDAARALLESAQAIHAQFVSYKSLSGYEARLLDFDSAHAARIRASLDAGLRSGRKPRR
ncbi:MAG TPA: hypothetical protein PLL10_11475, partial [Elusimicrobiales bacterium]|nr:hypothetical protein [Elusimicrobiales bacterium]